jgi:penicillin-insensitive murein endopeptidase
VAENHPADSGSAQSIGAFANGCIVGAQALPLNATGYQVMRTDQRRYFGHPDLVQFIQRLSNQVHNKGMGTVLIGDMGMPAGGRFNGGHASHQTGLDVDIFLQLPQTRWSSAQLLKPQALDLVASDGKRVVPSLWSPQISQLIKLAAKIATSRVFSSTRRLSSSCAWMPAAIATGCAKSALVPASRAYARPSALPGGQPGVRRSGATAAGDGCGAELQSWFEPPKPGSTLL